MKINVLKTSLYSIFGLLAIFGLFSFTSNAKASEMVILSTSNVTANSVTVSATARNIQSDTKIRVTFQYATNPSFVSANVTNEVIFSTSSATPVSYTITGLDPATTYYVRALGLGDNDGVATPSSSLMFTTGHLAATTPPSVNILTAKATGQNSFDTSMQYSLGSSSSADIWFEYGTSFGSYPYKTAPVSVGKSSGTHNETITGLQPGTTYYVRAVLVTSSNTYRSNTALIVVTASNTNNNNNNNNTYIYGCMTKGDPNYNSNANYHLQSMCANNSWFNNWFNWFGGNNNNNNNTGNQYTYNDPYSYNYPQNVTYTDTNAKDYCKYNNCDLNIGQNQTKKTNTVSSNTTTKKSSGLFGGLIVRDSTAKNTKTAKGYDASGQEAGVLFGEGNGFFPSTLVGWLALIFLILLILVLARHYFNKKKKPVEVKKV